MFKRRFAVLGAAVALTVAGLTGSALAGTPSSPPEPVAASVASVAVPGAGTLTCKTSDGKVIELARVKPADGGAVAETRPAQPADPSDVITQPQRAESVDPNGKPQVVSPGSGEGKAEGVKFRATRAAESGEPTADAPAKVRVVTPSETAETQAEKPAETIELVCKTIGGAGLDD